MTATSGFAAVCVLGRHGPHVTPVAAVEAGGRWWFTTSRRAAKVRLLRADPRVSITTVDADRTLVVGGRAVVLDHPLDLLAHPDLCLRLGPAAFRLAVDHFWDLTGYLAAAVDGEPIPEEWSPAGRVLVAITPERTTLLPTPVASRPAPTHRSEPIDMIGLADADGPFALPGTFDGERITIMRALLARRPDWSLGIAAMVEGPVRDRPTRQSGLLVRGVADSVVDDATGTAVGLRPASLVRWDGFTVTATRFDVTA